MKTNPSKKGKTMLFRLIGKLYFYFVILPFIGQVLKAMCDTYMGYATHKAADPEWTMQKQRAHQIEMRNRRRPNRTR
jgi:hypothetical protein